MEKSVLVHNTPMVPDVARVRRLRKEAADTWTIEIEPSAGAFPFQPGQFNMVYSFGVGEVPISISGDPAHPNLLVHTVRAVGAVTNSICAIKRNSMLGIRGPFGNGWPVDACAGNDVVIIAGGIGLAPLRSLLYQLLSERRKYGSIWLLYGARSPDLLLYKKELERWRGRLDLEAMVSVDTAGEEWRGVVGPVTTLIPRTSFSASETVAFVCGPEIMMRFAVHGLMEKGIPPDQIYISMERNMRCAIGLCGHCQFGKEFVCKEGPVFSYARVERIFKVREI